MSQDFFQLSHHYDTAPYPDWGSSPRGPLIVCDMAHRGELMEAVVGKRGQWKLGGLLCNTLRAMYSYASVAHP